MSAGQAALIRLDSALFAAALNRAYPIIGEKK
jgi:hypothetical protein